MAGAHLAHRAPPVPSLALGPESALKGGFEGSSVCGSLEGATMPNGQKYEDWLKSKDRGEDGKNDGSP